MENVINGTEIVDIYGSNGRNYILKFRILEERDYFAIVRSK